jgi:hypothetical protein
MELNSYGFEERNDFSKIGIKIVTDYLSSLKKTIKIVNVEDDVDYQKIDIDLIWHYKEDKNICEDYIEVKADSYTSGNFWLETLSNKKYQTQGCFLKSKAKYYFYYFSKWDKLYIIPLKPAQEWFKENMNRFRESETTTNNQGEYSHTTVGRIVPIQIIINELEGIDLIENVSKITEGF